MDFLIGAFIVIVGGCWLIAKALGKILFPNKDYDNPYIDKSVHHHHYYIDKRSIHVNGEEFKELKK